MTGEATPTLLGVGFIIGPKISAIMLGGSALAWLVIIPLFAVIGENISNPIYPAKILILQMSAKEIWHYYIRYIGAGAVAFGGLITLIRTLPTIIKTCKSSMVNIFNTECSLIDYFFRPVVSLVEDCKKKKGIILNIFYFRQDVQDNKMKSCYLV